MRKLLLLVLLIGLVMGLSACGATLQQTAKAPAPASGGTMQAHPGEALGYHAYQHDAWIEDTPFGY